MTEAIGQSGRAHETHLTFDTPTTQNHLLPIIDDQITWLDRTFGGKARASRLLNNAASSDAIAAFCSKAIGFLNQCQD